MSKEFEVIVAGLGAMGSASVYHLASSGRRVLGLDRFTPPHQLGSSHGLSRIIREAYFEHPLYVPLVQRAYQLWTDLEQHSGEKLFLKTGGLMIGPPDGVLVRGAKRSAEEHKLPHEILTSSEIKRRFEALAPSEEMVGVWEPRAGILFPEKAIETHLRLATQRGATLRFDEPVSKWEPDGEGVKISTSSGSYFADRLLLTSGAWLSSLVPGLNLTLEVERQVLYWFDPRSNSASFQPQQCPIHIWEYGSCRFFYGFPNLGDGVKVALHHQGQRTQPDNVRRHVDELEIKEMRKLLDRFLPAANGQLKSAMVCMYTNTPDEHFLLDTHPEYQQVLIASPCSGHGFKFSPVIGEICATLLNGNASTLDISLFGFRRFPGTGGASSSYLTGPPRS